MWWPKIKSIRRTWRRQSSWLLRFKTKRRKRWHLYNSRCANDVPRTRFNRSNQSITRINKLSGLFFYWSQILFLCTYVCYTPSELTIWVFDDFLLRRPGFDSTEQFLLASSSTFWLIEVYIYVTFIDESHTEPRRLSFRLLYFKYYMKVYDLFLTYSETLLSNNFLDFFFHFFIQETK